MAWKRNNKKKIEYARRLRDLKQKLQPYRNKETVNLLRVVTGSAGVNLTNYFDSLESVLTGDYSYRDVKNRIQKVVNEILVNGEYTYKAAYPHCEIDLFENKLAQIDLKPSVFNNDGHVKTDSKASVRHSDIDSKDNVFDNVGNSKIVLKPSVFNYNRHLNTDSKANVFGDMKHGDIDSKASVFDNVKHGDIDQSLNVLNRIKHLHIGSCTQACYRIKKENI